MASQTNNKGKRIEIARRGPKFIERTATEIKAKPPPEKPDFEIEKSNTQKDTIK